MSAITFDTHAVVRTLESAGMPTQQAEAVVSTVRQAQAGADVATQGDVVRLNAKIDVLDAKVDALGSKFDHLKWLTGAVLVAVLAPLIKALF